MSLGKLRAGERLALSEAAQEREKQLEKLILRLVKRDVCAPQLLLARERKALLPHLADERDVSADIELYIRRGGRHFVPLGQHLEKIVLYLQYELGKPGYRRFERRHGRFQPFADKIQIIRCADVALVVHTVAPGAPGDLLDFGGLEIAPLHAVKLPCVEKDHAPDGEIQPHADGVGRDNILHPTFEKALHLPPPRGVGERAVDDGGLLPVRTKILGHGENAEL